MNFRKVSIIRLSCGGEKSKEVGGREAGLATGLGGLSSIDVTVPMGQNKCDVQKNFWEFDTVR